MTPQLKSAIKLIDTLIELVAPLDPELGRHLAADWGRWDDNAKRNKAAVRKSIGGLLQIVMALLPHGLPASPLQAKARAACEEYIEYATGELHYFLIEAAACQLSPTFHALRACLEIPGAPPFCADPLGELTSPATL